MELDRPASWSMVTRMMMTTQVNGATVKETFYEDLDAHIGFLGSR